MKKVFALLCLLMGSLMMYAQERKFIFELGGAFNKTTLESSSPLGKNEIKNPKLNLQTGYRLFSRSYLGISYQFLTDIEKKAATSTDHQYHTSSTSESTEKTNAYGIFYRFYIWPPSTSRWNAFAEVSPSIQFHRSKTSFSSETRYGENLSEIAAVEKLEGRSDRKAIDTDLKIGGSYNVTSYLAVQLSLRSIANKHADFSDSQKLFEEKNNTSYRLFDSPLKNTYLSVLFTL